MNRVNEKAVGSSPDAPSSWMDSESATATSGTCSTETYDAADSDTISLTNLSSSSAPFLTESSESAAS